MLIYKSEKLPADWSSKIPARYKPTVTTGELHRAKRIANDFNFEVKRITKKFLSSNFPKILSGMLLNISIRIKMII